MCAALKRVGKVRGTRRKAGDTGTGKGRKGDAPVTPSKFQPTCYPDEHPMTTDKYRYTLAEPDPRNTRWQEVEEMVGDGRWSDTGLLKEMFRVWSNPRVTLATNDRPLNLQVSEDRLSVTGDKGYSQLRATHGVNRGRWFYEVTIEELPGRSATRIGWSQRQGILIAPCGFDHWSYSWRSKLGTVFHESRGKSYSPGYTAGDVLGFLIDLPDPTDPSDFLGLPDYKDQPLIRSKHMYYYEERIGPKRKERTLLTVARGSTMKMFHNGQPRGVAFRDVYEGVYYPSVSLYKNAKVKVNFGPRFTHPPTDEGDWRPMSEASDDEAIRLAMDNILNDVVESIENGEVDVECVESLGKIMDESREHREMVEDLDDRGKMEVRRVNIGKNR